MSHQSGARSEGIVPSFEAQTIQLREDLRLQEGVAALLRHQTAKGVRAVSDAIDELTQAAELLPSQSMARRHIAKAANLLAGWIQHVSRDTSEEVVSV